MLNRDVFGKKHFIVEMILLITTLDSAGGASHLKSYGRGRLLSRPVMAESAKYTQEITLTRRYYWVKVNRWNSPSPDLHRILWCSSKI